MVENRKNPRYKSCAHVRIPGFSGGENILKDISITGCCMECAGSVDLQDGAQYEIEILPEKASDIGEFELMVERKWVQTSDHVTQVGFAILASPRGSKFQNYVDYLAYRHNT